jgi:TPR repeat protein
LRAGQKGHLEAQYWLCILYREGIGVEANALESRYWCKRAAKKNHSKALYALGQWYYGGYDRNMNTDYLNAYVWFARAVVAGEPGADAMIQLLENQMTDLQILEAKKIMERNLP